MVAAREHRLTPKGRERRRQLLAVAAERFAAGGYHQTPVAEVVAAAGVGKGVFYWYFSSKEELFLELLRESQHELRRRQRAAIGDVADPLERIEAGIRASMAWLHEHRHLAALFAFAATEERFGPAWRQGREVAVADVARHVKEGIVEGRIRDADPVVLSHAVWGVTDHLARTFLLERDEPADEVADLAVAFCLKGLLP